MKFGSIEHLNVEPLRQPLSQSVTISSSGTVATLATVNPNVKIGDIIEIEEATDSTVFIGRSSGTTYVFLNTGSPTLFTDMILRFSRHEETFPNLNGSILKLSGALTAVTPTYTGTSNPTAYSHFYSTTNSQGLDNYISKIISIAPATTVDLSNANGFRRAVARPIYRARITDVSSSLTVLTLNSVDSSLPIPDAVYGQYTLVKRNVVKGNTELETATAIGLAFSVDSTSTGTVTSLEPKGSSQLKLTGLGLTDILGIKSPSGRSMQLTLTNSTGSTITVGNQNVGAAAEDRIVTGSGLDFDFENEATINLIYDPESLRWRLSSGGGASGLAGDLSTILQNQTLITSDYSIQTSYNGVSAGPVTIDTGVTVTIPVGSAWVII
jgi:hypothetical protein